MTPEQEQKLDTMGERLERVEIFLVGDKGLGTDGLKHKVEYHSKKIREFQNDKAKIIGGALTLGTIAGAISAWFAKHF